MTPDQIALVQESFKQVLPIKEAAADIFYDRLFALDPGLRKLFPADLGRQKVALMAMLATVVNGLTRLDALVPAVEKLGRRHAGYDVQAKDYDTVGQAFVGTLAQGLGDAFTPEVEDAWKTAYGVLAGVMVEAAATAEAAEPVA